MPLPNNPKMRVIPKEWEEIYEQYTEHSAWYSGDPQKLMDFYSSKKINGRHWAKEYKNPRRTLIHVPIASDISSISADMLFSESPTVRIPEAEEENNAEAATCQERLDQIINEGGFFNRILEGAETCSGLGGVFLKPNWDIDLAPFPILSVAQVDTALPEFKWGILTAVTFFKELEKDGELYYRLLERHEVVNGKSHILYGLYKGDRVELGIRVGLGAHPATADMPDSINTQIDGLAVRYIPNMKPHRKFRGISLGQSDYQGTEGMMDALDEVYTSWMRDIRLAKARIIVPESFLERKTDGSFAFDAEEEVFTSFDIDPLTAEKTGITLSQFAIRTQEHMQAGLELIDRIVTISGYAPQSFGIKVDGKAESGTALNIRERKSFVTTSKKQRYWKNALEDILEMMLIIDNVHLGNKYTIFRPTVEIHDSVKHDIQHVATAIELLARAEAISTETKVALAHPDWSKDQVKQEADRILKETARMMDDPMQVGME